MKINHHNNIITLAQCAVLLCALLFAHMAMGGASTSVLTSNNNKGAPESKSTSSNIEQYYKDVCLLPKSCSVSSIMNKDNDNKEIMSSSSHHSVCSHDTLHGLSITEHQLRKHVQNNNLHDNLQHTNDDVQIGIELQLSHIILEEASVGCALLYMHDTRSRMQANNEDETNENDSTNFVEGVLEQYAHTKVDDMHNGNGNLICPAPKTCQLHAANNDNGEVQKACDMQHFQQIQTSLDALGESSLQDNTSIIRQAELAKLQAELATIGCILMLRSQLNLHSSSSTSSSQQQQQQQLQIVLSSMLTKYQHSAELFNHFLHQNYVHFTSTPDMNSLVQTLQMIQNKCQKIQYVLTFAGRGEIPDIIWQERVSREKKVEVLTMEEENIRYQLLQLLQHRINDNYIKLSDLNTKEVMHDKERDDDSKGVWETIADEIEREREERLQMEVEMEAAMQKKEMEQRESRMKMKNVPQLSNQEHYEEEEEEKDLAAETSEEECSSSTGDNERKCTANSSLSPSSQDYILLDRMRKDIELLQQKANEARTDEERYVRLSLVTKMKEQLAQEIGT